MCDFRLTRIFGDEDKAVCVGNDHNSNKQKGTYHRSYIFFSILSVAMHQDSLGISLIIV
jgi:hypothetical protein